MRIYALISMPLVTMDCFFCLFNGAVLSSRFVLWYNRFWGYGSFLTFCNAVEIDYASHS